MFFSKVTLAPGNLFLVVVVNLFPFTLFCIGCFIQFLSAHTHEFSLIWKLHLLNNMKPSGCESLQNPINRAIHLPVVPFHGIVNED